MTFSLKNCVAASALATLALASAAGAAEAQAQKPNILVIMGDDIGYWNISAYNRGMMGYRTPNIDRIANEGASSPTITRSRPVPRAAPPSSPARARPHRLTKVGLPSARRASRTRTRPSPIAQAWATRPASSARTISATATISAYRIRLRRVLRQPLSPQRRGRARKPGLSEGVGLPTSPRFRPARRAQMRRDRDGDSRRRSALRPGQTDINDTGALTKKRMETATTSTSTPRSTT